MFENGGRMDDAGAWGYYNLTEPNGSGELKTSLAEFDSLKMGQGQLRGGGHLGHVTWTICIHFLSPPPPKEASHEIWP